MLKQHMAIGSTPTRVEPFTLLFPRQARQAAADGAAWFSGPAGARPLAPHPRGRTAPARRRSAGRGSNSHGVRRAAFSKESPKAFSFCFAGPADANRSVELSPAYEAARGAPHLLGRDRHFRACRQIIGFVKEFAECESPATPGPFDRIDQGCPAGRSGGGPEVDRRSGKPT